MLSWSLEETLLQSYKVFYAPKKCLAFIKKKKQNKTNAFGFMLSDVTLLFIIQCHTLT